MQSAAAAPVLRGIWGNLARMSDAPLGPGAAAITAAASRLEALSLTGPEPELRAAFPGLRAMRPCPPSRAHRGQAGACPVSLPDPDCPGVPASGLFLAPLRGNAMILTAQQAELVREYVREVRGLEEQRKAITAQIKDVWESIKGSGVDPRDVKEALRRAKHADREEAIGAVQLALLPLEQAIAEAGA